MVRKPFCWEENLLGATGHGDNIALVHSNGVWHTHSNITFPCETALYIDIASRQTDRHD
jgi:hypothetical protein